VTGHARLGPSNHRWPMCPGSVREEAAYPNISGEAAIDGTGSHLLLEMCLINSVDPIAYEGQIIGTNHEDNPMGWMVHRDRCDRVQMCLDYIVRRNKELSEAYPNADIKIEAESKSDPGAQFGRDDWWGTTDITITVLIDNHCLFLEVIDYKDGRGWVNATDNTQLISYLGGKLYDVVKSSVTPCRMTIVQPKTSPPVRYQDVTANDIAAHLIRLSAAATATDNPNAPLVPYPGGKGYCTWCKHKKNCSALADADIERLEEMDINTEKLSDIAKLSDLELADLADTKEALLARFAAVDAEIQQRLETGGTVPGYTMAPGRGSYKWNADDEAVIKALKSRRLKKNDYYPPKLISPAQMKKLTKLTEDQKKRIADQLVEYTPGKLTLKKVARHAATAPVVDFSSEAAAENVSFL